jgi:hypothetical protein
MLGYLQVVAVRLQLCNEPPLPVHHGEKRIGLSPTMNQVVAHYGIFFTVVARACAGSHIIRPQARGCLGSFGPPQGGPRVRS